MDHILVIEDDQRVHKTLRRMFEPEGYVVEGTFDGNSGLLAARTAQPSAVVLDLRLPGMRGSDVCREIKASSPNLPVIVLSATTDVVDKVALLEMGADDYVTKPFSPRELLARVRAAIRRSSRAAAPSDVYRFDDVVVDFPRMQVTRDRQPVALTAQEFKTLAYLTQHPERAISREELLKAVWGYNSFPTTRTVDNHILRLRQKLERDPANPVHFCTLHGVGYQFVP